MGKYDDLVAVKREDVLQLCRQRDTTIPKVARVIGCSPTTLYKYIKAGKIPRKLMNELCRVLIWRSEPNPPKEEGESVFPIYTKDLMMAKFYLTRALNKMDEIYMKGV